MALSLSVKDVPEALAQALRERAAAALLDESARILAALNTEQDV